MLQWHCLKTSIVRRLLTCVLSRWFSSCNVFDATNELCRLARVSKNYNYSWYLLSIAMLSSQTFLLHYKHHSVTIHLFQKQNAGALDGYVIQDIIGIHKANLQPETVHRDKFNGAVMKNDGTRGSICQWRTVVVEWKFSESNHWPS